MTPRAAAPRKFSNTLCVLSAALVVAVVLVARGASDGDARASSTLADAVTTAPCFGAAARNPLARCVNPGLRLTVFPAPQDALLDPNAACRPMGRSGLVYPCRFGASGSGKDATAVLIGDSHATAWRAAVDVVANALGWPALSITRSGCAFSKARVMLPASQSVTCRRWNREVIAWLEDHPEVTTLFVSTRANARYVRAPGASNFETAVAGHLALWGALPATIKSVLVLRDTPYGSTAAQDCLQRAFAHHKPAGIICARDRATALHRGPAATAARRLRSPRVHVLDMTPFFCSSARCYPVVGGALVAKDTEHLTSTFAKTLGRFMVPMVARYL